ncbi:two-component system response regulator YesN [Anaerotaenia torta]|uniref:response regulator n=1 Tax=Anaerotaenia torta TaxID=433293 RepID=UPI003D24279B
MYQLMIIDDEPVVRTGIKQLIPWEDYNFQICAEGLDGKDGLRKVLEYLPDLVLVDVKMPGMSGIELIREAKKEGFEGKFIILTGYSDFEFAKSAVNLGVRAYLLKPIDEDELLENIREVLDELDAKKHLDDYYTLSELKARQEVLHRLLQHSADKETLRREIRLYGMDFNYHSFCTAIISARNSDPAGGRGLSKECQDAMMRELTHGDKLEVDDRLVLICKGQPYQEVLRILLKNNERMKRITGESVFIAIGHDVANWEDLSFSYECAKLLSEYEFLYRDNEAVSIEILNQMGMNEVGNFTDQLFSLIEIGDSEAIRQVLRDLKNNYKNRLMKEAEIKVLVIHNMVLLHSILERRYENKQEELPDFDQLIEGIKHVESLEGLMELVEQYCLKAKDCIGASTTDVVVKRMIAFMEKNYDQDLKLEAIARLFNYNSAYLGKIFKKEMGESFNNMLDHIRIANAKRLLTETNLKIYQVSKRVGYGNIDYFYSKFKKYVGISPKEFKKQ